MKKLNLDLSTHIRVQAINFDGEELLDVSFVFLNQTQLNSFLKHALCFDGAVTVNLYQTGELKESFKMTY